MEKYGTQIQEDVLKLKTKRLRNVRMEEYGTQKQVDVLNLETNNLVKL
jgi:hypothetical protein